MSPKRGINPSKGGDKPKKARKVVTLAAYKQLYQEKVHQARQTRLTSFFSVTSAPADASTSAATSASPTAATADDFPDLSGATLPSTLHDDDDDDADSPQAYSTSTPPSTQ